MPGRTEELPGSPDLLYEIKLDGYRAIAFKSGGNVHLRSRNDDDFSRALRGHCQRSARHARRLR
jgi:ATP-dependent DNA ligase